MAHSSNSHNSGDAQVPAELVARSQNDWHIFTRAIIIQCVGVAGFLLLMLLFFRVF